MSKFKITLKDIPLNNNYQGYLWWSSEKKPEVYNEQNLPGFPESTANPFIIEGNLYDKENRISYLIRFIDGAYLVYRFNPDDFTTIEKTEKEYLPKHFPVEIKKLCFTEYWEPKPDEYCEGMPVLKPTAVVFTGFKTKEDKS